MGKNIILIVDLIILAISVILIYDARKIAKQFFSTGRSNETTKTLKIVGFIVSIVGIAIILFAL